MLGRYGRAYAALGGLIAAIVVLGIVGESHAQTGSAQQEEQGGAGQHMTASALPYASVYQPPCDKAATSKDGQDCEQARSAGATISQARWAFWQLIVGTAGVAAVVATLAYTARATHAAERAADAAQKAISQQAETDKRQLRAYVFAESGTLGDGALATPPVKELIDLPRCFIIIKNSGQTPAYNVIHWADIRVLEPDYEHTLTVPTQHHKMPGTAPSSIGAGGMMNRPGFAGGRLV